MTKQARAASEQRTTCRREAEAGAPSTRQTARNAAGLPPKQGLYDPAFEHDACGVGFITNLDAEPRHSVVEDAIRMLVNLEHRGAVGGDKATGDGAGLLLQLPDAFLRKVCSENDIALPAAGDYGVGMLFLPVDDALAARCAQAFEQAAADEGCEVIGWRDVPVEAAALGEFARGNQPRFRQVFVGRSAVPADAFERKLYVVRRRIEKDIAGWHEEEASKFYVASLSARTIVYKGMLVGSQLATFYPDLCDEQFASAFAIIHQRYSTNTFPSWSLAQPFRTLAHNGEINTLRGNVNRMRGREAIMRSDVFGPDIEKIKPAIVEGGSDSAMLDNTLELLVLGGRSLPHAAMMMVPEAWGTKFVLGEDRRAFYEYHAAIMEPWDGPSALVFTDGRYVGATLDRNGLRPTRYTITRGGLVVVASETGVLDIPSPDLLEHGRLQPGKMLLVDLEQHRLIPDAEIKSTLSRRRPYRRWLGENRIELRGLLTPSHIPSEGSDVLRQKQHAFGYTQEELKMVIAPMAARGQEAIGSMGNDAALAVLSERPQLLFSYFKQHFAQVTNPPIDPLREELVMSLMSFVGRQRGLLEETPEHCRQLKLHHPILTPTDVLRIRHADHADVVVREIDMLFSAKGGRGALASALEHVFDQAEKHIADGATILVLTDRHINAKQAPIPALLATAGLHHHLIRKGLRTAVGIVVETGEAREVIHFAQLIAYGANAICPYLAFLTVRKLVEVGLIEPATSSDRAADAYTTAVKKGLLKTFSRMGISTIRSFFGSQIFEAVGLAQSVIDRYFCGTVSRVGGIGLDEIAAETVQRHQRGFPETGAAPKLLDSGGAYSVRKGCDKHLWSPEAIYKLQHATRSDDYETFKEYVDIIDTQADGRITLRTLLRFKDRKPVPIDEVEPAEAIIKRFAGAAMSHGSISKEAHETIAVALNRLGARSNSGEGGEDPARYVPMPNGDSKRSATKQIASARFGVTIEYLVNANGLQIKMAQGAKPGEGGQLPGHKVSEEIGRIRHTMPGVTLISPPPHHDIYSIEDIAQLIHDLKCANPDARVSVKLVSEAGIGTIAAGVAKAKADMVLISGHDGGTGASPLTAIKHAGLPWELGLAETQQTLCNNRLRDRIRVQVDGQLRTGRDLAIAALLGAEEFGFGCTMLVCMGCVMLRKCHLNTCSVGVATQDPELRKRFAGKPEYVERFFRFIAQNFREQMARLGFRTVDEMVGQSDLLAFEPPADHTKARLLDYAPMLLPGTDGERRCVRSQDHALEEKLDNDLIRQAQAAIDGGEPVEIEMPIRNVHRTVGTMLSGEIAKKHGLKGLPDDTIRLSFKGSAGQSLAAFLAAGVTIHVEGAANDYVGKGLSGGKIVVVPPADAAFEPHRNIIIGNTALYGATAGQLNACGIAGERFAVRNSGARAVVEGVGDHGCEYMTGGAVVVLGETGYNFAAGMSGGIAYVYDEHALFGTRCNLDMVDLESVTSEDDSRMLREMIEEHLETTGSARARSILDGWETCLPMFVKVMPTDYRKALARIRMNEHVDRETLSATEEVFHE